MKMTMRKPVRLGLVAGLAVTGLVGVTSLTAAGQTSPPQEVVGELVLTVPGGSLRTATVEVFETDTSGQRLDNLPDLTQVFTAAAACPTLESQLGSDSVVDITATTARVPVLPNNGIGVTDNTSCGSSGAIVASEALSLVLLSDALPQLFGDDVDVQGGSITVFRDNGGGNLRVGFDGGTRNQLGTNLVNGVNTPRTFNDRFETSIQISSTSSNDSKGIYLRGATFTLVRDIQNQAPVASFTGPTIDNDLLQATFNDTSTDDGTIEIRSWDFGDGSDPVVNPANPVTKTGNTRSP